jgi:two-component system sensor histidine kinase/response regulator
MKKYWEDVLEIDEPQKTLILVIEDEEELRETIKEVLELKDFRVIVAENGKIGIKKAIDHKPDLIICDIMMPEVDGYEVVTEVRKNPDLDLVPFVFLSAKHTSQDLRLGMGLGADDYLVKPFKIHELLQTVETRLKKIERLKKAFLQHYSIMEEYIFINSHMVRGPLCNILGLIRLMAEMEPFKSHEWTKMLLESAQKLDQVITEANKILSIGLKLDESSTLYSDLDEKEDAEESDSTEDENQENEGQDEGADDDPKT